MNGHRLVYAHTTSALEFNGTPIGGCCSISRQRQDPESGQHPPSRRWRLVVGYSHRLATDIEYWADSPVALQPEYHDAVKVGCSCFQASLPPDLPSASHSPQSVSDFVAPIGHFLANYDGNLSFVYTIDINPGPSTELGLKSVLYRNEDRACNGNTIRG